MKSSERKYHSKFAIEFFNYTWKLLEKKLRTKKAARDLFLSDIETVIGFT